MLCRLAWQKNWQKKKITRGPRQAPDFLATVCAKSLAASSKPVPRCPGTGCSGRGEWRLLLAAPGAPGRSAGRFAVGGPRRALIFCAAGSGKPHETRFGGAKFHIALGLPVFLNTRFRVAALHAP